MSILSELVSTNKRKLLLALFLVWVLCLTLFFLVEEEDETIGWKAPVAPRANLPRAPYANWVHGHWLTTSMENAMSLVKSLGKSEIHVDALLFQDDFFTVHNDFQGQLRQTAAALRRLGVHVVVVLDAIIPQSTPELAFAMAQSFCVANRDDAVYSRHIGGSLAERKGCLVNFQNPAAARWFTNVVVKPVLQCGVEGLMLEPMVEVFMSLSPENGAVDKSEAYSAQYYYSMFDFGRSAIGFDFVAVFRAVSSIGSTRSMRAIGPQDISFAAQVGGGEAATFEGLQETALHLLNSADRGYINAGVSLPETFLLPPSPDEDHNAVSAGLFLRWLQLAAGTSLMKLNTWIPPKVRPWDACRLREREVCSNAYRKAVALHRSLRPYFYSLASHSFYDKMDRVQTEIITNDRKGGDSIGVTQRTFDHKQHPHVLRTLHDASFLINVPANWDYMIGPDVFVAPVLNASDNTGVSRRSVTFPTQGQWVPMALSEETHHGQRDTFFAPRSTVEMDVSLDEVLMFQRRGSIVPMASKRLPQIGSLYFVIEGPQHVRRRPSMQDRFVPLTVQNQIRQFDSKVNPSSQGDDKVDPEVGIVYGEHDHGAVLWYHTRLAPVSGNSVEKPFFMDVVLTPYQRPVVIEIRRVRCAGGGCAPLLAGGYHPFESESQFWSSGLRSGLRAVYFGEHSTLLFDPFSSLGNRITLGPYVSF